MEGSLSTNNWEEYELGEMAVEVRNLFEPIKNEELPYIGLEHIDQNTLKINSIGQSKDTVSTKKMFLPGDILFGTLRPYFRKVVRPKFKGVCSTDITVVRAKEHCTSDFLFYFIANHPFIDYATNISTGTRMPRANWKTLSESTWKFPPLPTQRKIAAILSAYDDLIENNLRRIKILEEMAQNLYREWFVKFRFPGHEQVRFVDSEMGRIPEGWEVLPFAEIAKYLNGYAFMPKDLGSIGKPIIKIKELKAGINNNTPRNPGIGIPEKYIINNGDVLFSWSASLDVYYWGEGEGLLNQHLFKVIPNNNISEIYIYHALKEAMPRFRSLSLGATMQHIKRSALDQVFNVLPDENIRTLVDSHLNPIHHQIITINTKVKNLRHTRDLLLPRLISGEVDVSELNINLPNENGL